MPTVSDLGNSNYIKKSDVDPPALVTIVGWRKENLPTPADRNNMEYVLEFKENIKPLVLKTTNGNIIASIAGTDDFDEWVKKQIMIVLYVDPNVDFGGKLIGGIRCRAPKPGFTAPETAAQPDDDAPF